MTDTSNATAAYIQALAFAISDVTQGMSREEIAFKKSAYSHLYDAIGLISDITSTTADESKAAKNYRDLLYHRIALESLKKQNRDMPAAQQWFNNNRDSLANITKIIRMFENLGFSEGRATPQNLLALYDDLAIENGKWSDDSFLVDGGLRVSVPAIAGGVPAMKMPGMRMPTVPLPKIKLMFLVGEDHGQGIDALMEAQAKRPGTGKIPFSRPAIRPFDLAIDDDPDNPDGKGAGFAQHD